MIQVSNLCAMTQKRNPKLFLSRKFDIFWKWHGYCCVMIFCCQNVFAIAFMIPGSIPTKEDKPDVNPMTETQKDALNRTADIPEALKECPPPESLATLDKQMDGLIEDIKVMLEARSREFQVDEERKAKLPTFPEQ